MAVAHLGHAEIRVTDLERSRWFFTEILGLYVTEENDERVYLRAWQDWDHHTLILRTSDHPGIEHVGWRVETPEDMGSYEKQLKELGVEFHWIEGGEEPGQGDGLRFLTPGGMPFELYCFEPSGNRVEVWTGGFLIFPPDWTPIRWTPKIAELGYELWGSQMPDTYLSYGTESHFSYETQDSVSASS